MSEKVASVHVEVGADLRKVSTGLRQTRAIVGQVGGSLGQLTSLIMGPAGLAVALLYLGKKALGTANELAKLGDVANRTHGTFTRLVGGVAASAAALEELRAATKGGVDDLTLMAASSKFLSMHLAENAAEAAHMARVSTQLGMAMNMTGGPTKAMESFALMLANKSIRRLDEFGISADRVRKRLKDMGSSVANDADFIAAVMAEAAATMDRVGEQSATSAEKQETAWSNLRVAIGSAIAETPAYQKGMEAVTGTVELFTDVVKRAGQAAPFLGVYERALKGIREEGQITARESRVLSYRLDELNKMWQQGIISTEIFARRAGALHSELSKVSFDIKKASDYTDTWVLKLQWAATAAERLAQKEAEEAAAALEAADAKEAYTLSQMSLNEQYVHFATRLGEVKIGSKEFWEILLKLDDISNQIADDIAAAAAVLKDYEISLMSATERADHWREVLKDTNLTLGEQADATVNLLRAQSDVVKEIESAIGIVEDYKVSQLSAAEAVEHWTTEVAKAEDASVAKARALVSLAQAHDALAAEVEADRKAIEDYNVSIMTAADRVQYWRERVADSTLSIREHIYALNELDRAQMAIFSETMSLAKAELGYYQSLVSTHGQLAIYRTMLQGLTRDQVEYWQVLGQIRGLERSIAMERISEQRSLVMKALTPTKVTPADMAAAQAGEYIDKWDEASRQLRALVETGVAGADWKQWLTIPEEVLAEGPERIKQWAAEELFLGLTPEQVNWEAFKQNYARFVEQGKREQALIEEAMRQTGATEADIKLMFGIEGAIPAGAAEAMKVIADTKEGMEAIRDALPALTENLDEAANAAGDLGMDKGPLGLMDDFLKDANTALQEFTEELEKAKKALEPPPPPTTTGTKGEEEGATDFQYGGTMQRGGYAVVGHGGPELAWLPGGAQVTPAAATREILRSSMQISLVQQFYGPADPALVKGAAEEGIMEGLRTDGVVF